MTLYKALFYILYKSLNSIESGFTNQTDETRAFGTITIISVFELLNFMTFWPHKIDKEVYLVPLFLIFGSNYLIFCLRDRYKKYINEVAVARYRIIYFTLAIVYLVASILFAVYT